MFLKKEMFLNKWLGFFALLLLTISLPSIADPMSAQYRLRWATFDGAATSSSSASYNLKGSFGQSSVVGEASSSSFQVAGGLFSIPDTDEDTFFDFLDNCVNVANPSQYNANASVDIYGNACDADFDNNNFVNANDLAIFKSHFFTDNAETDLNNDDFVNANDLAIFKTLFFKGVGPSGLPTP